MKSPQLPIYFRPFIRGGPHVTPFITIGYGGPLCRGRLSLGKSPSDNPVHRESSVIGLTTNLSKDTNKNCPAQTLEPWPPFFIGWFTNHNFSRRKFSSSSKKNHHLKMVVELQGKCIWRIIPVSTLPHSNVEVSFAFLCSNLLQETAWRIIPGLVSVVNKYGPVW